MLKFYGYIGLILVILAEANFFFVIQPFALWYIPIVWFGYILFVDSLVYRVRKKSLLSSYPKELAFMILLSLPFWSIFEIYNLYTGSWQYINYTWYVHLADFATIMPAVLETFSLFNALEIGKSLDRKVAVKKGRKSATQRNYLNIIKLLAVIGAFASVSPLFLPSIGFPLMWFGLFLLIDPLNYLIGRTSIVQKVSQGQRSMALRLALAGITMGFFWEFWNYQAYPKWFYTLPSFIPSLKLFAMPLVGYLGYMPFGMEAFLFFVLFRSFFFQKGNDVLSID